MFEWRRMPTQFFLLCLNRKRKTCGKTISQVFFFALAAPKKVLKLAGFAQLHAVRFFAENGACTTIFPQIFFEKKNLHGQADVFVFLSSLFSAAAALSENGSVRGGQEEAMHINVHIGGESPEHLRRRVRQRGFRHCSRKGLSLPHGPA